MRTGIERIAAERARQVDVEGWAPEHDRQHDDESLATAAVCYAMPKAIEDRLEYDFEFSFSGCYWPWRESWFKREKHSRIRQLEIAGALIAAEIDRLLAAMPRLSVFDVVESMLVEIPTGEDVLDDLQAYCDDNSFLRLPEDEGCAWLHIGQIMLAWTHTFPVCDRNDLEDWQLKVLGIWAAEGAGHLERQRTENSITSKAVIDAAEL